MRTVDNGIRESSTTAGTGNITLAGEAGWLRFSDIFAISPAAYFLYQIRNDDAVVGSAEIESGIGYLADADTLVRDKVLRSTNSNAAVDFSSGAKVVTCGATAEWIGMNRRPPQAGDLGYDIVFNRDGATTPPTGWAWVNQGTSTMLEQDGCSWLSRRSQAAEYRMIRRAIPSEASFLATAKITMAATTANYSRIGLLHFRSWQWQAAESAYARRKQPRGAGILHCARHFRFDDISHSNGCRPFCHQIFADS